MKSILFIDRDGTLIEEPKDFQIDSAEKFALLPNVIPALLRLKNAGFEMVMVTNQDGLGTEKYPKESFALVQRLLLQILSSQGIEFKEILICPHTAEDKCSCRKPATSLVQRYLASNEMDRERSFVIGDQNQ
jgi:imidazoleglycerol-phosphate dehydratase/histidinol-phosphatase